MPLPRKTARDVFVKTVWAYYRTSGRHDLPWRKTRNPYRILVSEIMLQQTQAERVRGYYTVFLKQFPTISELAHAPASHVISAWQGLGYNRRALALHRAAKVIVKERNGMLPRDEKELLALPGIGPYTAGALRAFVWNKPGTLLETNVRTAYIHHFYKDAENVPDTELVPIIEATTDQENPREWYWALMDYGAHLKLTVGNATRRSATYATQKKFAGSNRQLRGRILRIALSGPCTATQIKEVTGEPVVRITAVLEALTTEGFLANKRGKYVLKD